MCGFFGSFNIKRKLNLNLLKHRGPDSFGYYEDEYLYLGFCRLKIIDLSDKANQPMEFDNLVMAFNGEIYNFLELKRELKEYELPVRAFTGGFCVCSVDSELRTKSAILQKLETSVSVNIHHCHYFYHF